MTSDSAFQPGTQTLARGLAVIGAVASGTRDLRGLVETTGVARSTTHRLVQLLIQEGYLRRGRDGDYQLGPILIEYGFLALHQNPLPVVARPVLERLNEKYQDTVHLALEDNGQVLYIEKLPGHRGAEMRSRIGYRMPLTTTGIGKSLILDRPEMWEPQLRAEREASGLETTSDDVSAFLDRMHGYAELGATMDLEENEPGIRCVAAPIRDGTGRIAAALSIAAIRPYMPTPRMRTLVPVVHDAAHEISVKLGYNPTSRARASREAARR